MDNLVNQNHNDNVDENRRSFIKKAAYTAPVIMTMAALPAFASTGSGQQPKYGRRHRNPGRNGNGGGQRRRAHHSSQGRRGNP
ncbi:hypothetical protein MNBD_GAMMA10-2058 [hydrothermal vent metagenome]|uniref:Uncharacterized protein n=1 Tax=hydrothermal vent metagenome TaxID=652676 RepID=A0A3B0XDY3_9ZZZZ